MTPLLQKRKLIGLPVETASGQPVGRVCDFDLDPRDHRIFRYYVQSGHRIPGLLHKQLIVSVSQVVRLTEEQMVVDDAIAREPSSAVVSRAQNSATVSASSPL